MEHSHPRLPVVNLIDDNIVSVGGSLPYLPQKCYTSNLLCRSASKPLLNGKDSPTNTLPTNAQSRLGRLQAFTQDASCGSFLSLHQVDTRDAETERICTSARILKTIVLYLSFFALGLVNGVMGPTLMELQSIANTSTAKAALLFTWGAIGRVPGSLATAFTFGKLCPNLQLAGSVLLTAVSTCLLPWCQQYIFMAVVMAFQGFGIGSMGGGCTAYCFKLWTITAAPYIQALAFTIALGNTCAPLLARPFLTTRRSSDVSYTIPSLNQTSLTNSSHRDLPLPASNISDLYLIISSVLILSALLYLLLYLKDRFKPNQLIETKVVADANLPITVNNRKHSLSCTLFGIFMFCCAGLEVTYGGLVFTFAVDHLEWNTSNAAYLTFAYWICVAAGRGLGIILVRYLSPCNIVVLDLCGACTALIIMATCSGRHVVVEWVCSCLLGASLSTLVATTLNLAYAYIHFSGQLASIFMCCNYVGIMVLPGLAGALFRMLHGMCFVFVCLATAVAMVIVFVAIRLIHGGKQGSSSMQTESFEDQDI